MSIRERWIVYPLLFLAILLGARDGLLPDSRQSFRSIECQELVVRNINGERLVLLGESGDQSGMVVVYGPTATTRNLMQPNSADGTTPSVPLIELSGDPDGGAVRLHSADERPTIFAGHWAEDRLSGLLAYSVADELVLADTQSRGQPWGLTLRLDGSGESSAPADDQTISGDANGPTSSAAEAGGGL